MREICRKCRKRNCKYKSKVWKDCSLYLENHCAKKVEDECKQIATDDFRSVIFQLEQNNYESAGAKGIITQGRVILNIADDIQ